MKKTVILRTADGLIGTALRVEKATFVVERVIPNRGKFDPDKPIEPFQPHKIRRYRFEGDYHYTDTVPQKSFEIFDEVV